MKVSLRRKIHIMAFRQDAVLKARWSEDQSATSERKPPGCRAMSWVGASVTSGIGRILSEGGAADRGEPGEGGRIGEHREEAEPGEQQEMPVGGAELDTKPQD